MTKEMMQVTFNPDLHKEILPSPKFDGVWWMGIPEEEQLEGKSVNINGQDWEINVIGFQGSDARGSVRMHEEPDMQEDVFMVSGVGTMWVWDGLDCGLSTNQPHEMKGPIQNRDVSQASYTLAVASYMHPQFHCDWEYLVLNVESEGKTYPIDPVSTPQGFQHRTELNELSTYFVIKRKKV
ncbi:MAG: hypothetical protein WCL07_04880 [bacterium]